MPTADEMKTALVTLYRAAETVMNAVPEYPSECTDEESDRYDVACHDYSAAIERAIDLGRRITESTP